MKATRERAIHRTFLGAAVLVLVGVAAGCGYSPFPGVNVPGTLTLFYPPPRDSNNGIWSFGPPLVCVDTNTAVSVTFSGGPSASARLEFDGVDVLDGQTVSQPFGPGCATFVFMPSTDQFKFGPNEVVSFEKATAPPS